MEKTVKPDWVTDEQWEAVPNVNHWEESRKAMQSLEQLDKLPPITHEEAVAHQRKMYEEAGLSSKHLDELYKKHK